MKLEEGDVVLCTVDRIVGTVVFVKIQGINGDTEGSIVTSEIAPGRIRNLRDYVIPKKKIVCKVLRISKEGNIELTLRRVTPKERKEIMNQYKQEKNYNSIIKSVLGEKAEQLINEISKTNLLPDFIEQAKENPRELERLIGKKDSEKILKILKSEKQKKAIIKKEIALKTAKPNGLKLIKSLLELIKDAEIKYVCAGKYSIKSESTNLKKADNKLQEILKDIEKKAKKLGVEFGTKDKK